MFLIKPAELGGGDLPYLRLGNLFGLVCHFGALITPLPPLKSKARIVIFRRWFKALTGHDHYRFYGGFAELPKRSQKAVTASDEKLCKCRTNNLDGEVAQLVRAAES